MSTKRLIERLVRMARLYSEDARKAQLKDRAAQGDLRHFYDYLGARSVRSAYMHAARLVKEEQQSAAAKMRGGKVPKRWLKAFKTYPPHKPDNMELQEGSLPEAA